MSSNLLENLNDAQKQAVTHTDGPLLIVAGAGTGKTTVITKRIAWLIEQGHAKPEQILALTFTDKAAGEMEERVDLLLPYGYVDLQISTFHSFCERLLRDYGAQIGLSPEFQLLTELDGWLLVRQQLDRFDLDYYRPLGNPTKYLRALLQHFSRAKDNAITSAMYLQFSESEQADQDSVDEKSRVSELARAYHTYQQILLEHDSLDFGDLILYTLQLLQERPTVLKTVQERFRYVLVDEFQDTNHAQYELIRLLSQPRNNLTVVGDDDQAIYKFRGASIENILRFERDYFDCRRVVLTTNYRSAQSILDHAYDFIQKNNPHRLEAQSEHLSKKLTASCEEHGQIEHLHANTSEEEVGLVVKKILALREQDAESVWNDFAVLVRSNGAGSEFAHAFEQQQIPFQFLALSGLYNKPVILDALALLRVIDQPHDSPSLFRVLSFPHWALSALTIAELNRLATRKGKSLFETIPLAKAFSVIDPMDLTKLESIISLLTAVAQKAISQPVSEVFLLAMKESQYLEQINQGSEQKKREQFRFLQQYFERIKSFERRSPHKSLHEFLAEFKHERDAGEEGSLSVDLDVGPDMVRIMTIHAAKGLEFKHVFVVHLVDRKFPTQRRADAIPLPIGLDIKKEIVDESLFHLEEERRLFYVAMTRAKRGLYLTSADDYGGARARKRSRFLDELGYPKSESSRESILSVLDLDQEFPEQILEDTNLSTYLPKQFSFTQLAAFKTCPLQYKFAHLLHIPVLGRWTFSFGKTMHNTLHHYFAMWIERTGKKQESLFGEDQSQEDSKKFALPVTMDELMDLYKMCWQDDWYPNDHIREQYRQKGREQLIRYVKTFEQTNPSPVALEQGYTYKIGDVTLKGRIDRIDAFEDGVEIIDYKTGSPKTAKTLERSDKEQLWLYQLAARDVLKLNPKKLTFVYLEDQSTVSFLGTDEDLIQLQEDVMERVGRIRKSAFGPTPGFHCRSCDYADICEYRQT